MSRARSLTLRLLVLAAAVGALCVWGVVRVSGGSMEPTLAVGDVVFFERGSAPAPGGLLVFEHPGWPGGVVHRAVRLLPDGSAITKGDANPIADLEPVPPSSVRGRVVAVLPAGRAVRALARRLGRCYTPDPTTQ